ncbi:MAG: hypothetical protein ACI9XZ_000653 [Alphaproteobacteria bacterium]
MLIDRLAIGLMAAVCNHILHVAVKNPGRGMYRARRLLPLAAMLKLERVHSAGLLGWKNDFLMVALYDEGVAHAEVPTSSVRVC